LRAFLGLGAGAGVSPEDGISSVRSAVISEKAFHQPLFLSLTDDLP
jgi:hypothetical protein